MAIEVSPMKRSCPSLSSVSRRNASRQVPGATNGSSPSSTSTSAHAARNVSGTARSPTSRLLCAGTRRAFAATGLLQVLEELGVRIEHHQVALAPERRLVGLEAAVERIELGILPICGGIDRRRLGVAVALGLLRRPVRVGKDHLTLPIGVGADLLGIRGARRAQLGRDSLALRIHALIDLGEHILGKLHAAQPYVNNLDSDLLRIRIGTLARRIHNLVAFGRNRFVDGALVDFLAEDGADRLGETLLGQLLVVL